MTTTAPAMGAALQFPYFIPYYVKFSLFIPYYANLQICESVKTFKQSHSCEEAGLPSLLIQSPFSSGLRISSGYGRPTVGDEVSSTGSGMGGSLKEASNCVQAKHGATGLSHKKY